MNAFHPPRGLEHEMRGIPDQPAAWSATLSNILDLAIAEAGTTQLYNPLTGGGAPTRPRDVIWTAFPRRLVYRMGAARALALADDLTGGEPGACTAAGTALELPYREQQEYCEWRVTRDGAGKITRVAFTTEPLEYWWSLAQGYPPPAYGAPPPDRRPPATGDLGVVLGLYRRWVDASITLADLTFADNVHGRAGQLLYARGSYNPWNPWNTTRGILHLSMVRNSLCAFLSQTAAVTVGRRVDGHELTDPTRVLGAMDPGQGGAGINDATDTAQAGVIGALVRAGARVTLRDPVAIVMRHLDTSGWKMPRNGGRPEDYWHIRRGVAGDALFAEYVVPPAAGFTVSDIQIGGEPIRHGGQIARCLTVGFGIEARQGDAANPRPAAGSPLRLRGTDTITTFVLPAPADPRYEEIFPLAPPPAWEREPILDDDDIQGNVLAGFNKDHQWLIGFDVEDPARARLWLEARSYQLSTTKQVAAYNERYRAGHHPPPAVWFNLALSHAGLVALGGVDGDDFASPAFTAGIAARGLFGDLDREPHILAIIAADLPGLLPTVLGTVDEIRHKAPSWGLSARTYPAAENRGGHEHFGFRDGISQPGIRGRLSAPGHRPLTPRDPAPPSDPNGPEFARPGRPLVWPGEVVLGYPRQDLRHPRAPAPAARCVPAWSRNGSFLVVLRFQQDVQAFKAFLAEEHARTGRPEGEIAAHLLGRWPSGSPLVTHPNGDGGHADNDFLYADGDPAGQRCPFDAHIRKVNPRDESTDEGATAATLRRRLLRRGITYGPAHDGTQDGADRGLYFIAYMASIEEQLELVWGWIHDPVRPSGGRDAFLAGRPWVKLLQGGYFFSPSISAVRRLAVR